MLREILRFARHELFADRAERARAKALENEMREHFRIRFARPVQPGIEEIGDPDRANWTLRDWEF